MSAIAFVGLGTMGSRMARRLIDAGHDVTVWNRTRSKAEELVAAGATVADTPAAAAGSADATMIIVADPGALQDVTEGPDGVLGGARPGTTVIQMSTVSPAAVARLSSALPPDRELLDAPVLGSTAEAESGSLRIFVGGAEAALERWTDVLSALGSPVHVGPVGAGTAAKLVANSTLFGVLATLGEALSLANRLGIPRDLAFEILKATPLAAQADRRRPSIESGEYPPRFSLELALKDADLILEAASGSNADLRLAAAARSWLADARDAGWGERDYSAVLAHIIGET